MKIPRSAVIAGAAAAGLGAIILVASMGSDPEPVHQVTEAAPAEPPRPLFETESVLVAARDLPFGTQITDSDTVWAEWPKLGLGTTAIKRSEETGAQENVRGAIARGSFMQGEPIRRHERRVPFGALAGGLTRSRHQHRLKRRFKRRRLHSSQ
jgi:pilus assembly protein CpaB